TTERVSLTDTGGQIADFSAVADMSADGRYVVFQSRAAVVGGSDGSLQIYVRDRVAGTTERVSVNSFGQPADDSSGSAVISADGRCVAFTSRADNLSPDDANGREFDDVFGRPVDELYVRDRFTGENIAGLVGGNPSGAHLSGNGRVVVFTFGDDVWLVSNPL